MDSNLFFLNGFVSSSLEDIIEFVNKTKNFSKDDFTRFQNLVLRWLPKSMYIRQYWPLDCSEDLNFEDLELNYISDNETESIKLENDSIVILKEDNWKNHLYKFLQNYLLNNLPLKWTFKLSGFDFENDKSFLIFMHWKFGLAFNKETKFFEL